MNDIYSPVNEKEVSDFIYECHKESSPIEIIGNNSKKIGRVENINSKLPQPVFEIIYDSRKVLIPIHEDLIKKIDKKNRILYLDIPNGLLEII